ncbi:MAG: dienelactone hydrolase family protein [Solirubrobacterales bacterium]|nr:dienelactone hydrolase family protein [Solirubrobacterales bacterium]
MNSSSVDITTPDGVANAYLSRPDDDPHPGVLFIMDAYGLRPTIDEMVDRIASDDYIVLAPNVFYRAGRSPVPPVPDMSDPEQRAGFFQSLRPLMDELTAERLAADGAAYLDYLARTGAQGPVAITGYCMGARLAWRIAAAHPDRVAALAGFHAGGLVTDAPDSPHLSAGNIKAELYFGFADQDRSMTPEQISTLEQALSEAGARYSADVYAGAQHGYTMADTPAYNEAARERHFRELRVLLARTLSFRT